MRTVRDGDPLEGWAPSVLTIGVFDGLHRGHQALLARVVELAPRYDAAASVVTFDPTPAQVLAPAAAPLLLSTVAQRLEGFAALGVEQARILTFNPGFAQQSARAFIERVLVGELAARCVIVGEDFHFGQSREGSVAILREVGEEFGFDVEAAPLFGDDERWSSTKVRHALERGDVEEARAILGYPFTLRGVVKSGDHRGSELGFPTANLALSRFQQLPAEGVYAAATEIEGAWRAAAVSVGTRPQFYEDGELLVEAFVLDFSGDLYDRTLDVAFLRRLRDQEAFAEVRELTRQIERDVAETRSVFEIFSKERAELLR